MTYEIVPLHYNAKDISGLSFGRLTAIAPIMVKPVKWICICECGTESVSVVPNLMSGHTTSCGCLSSRNTIGDRVRTHGMRYSSEYSSWCAMHGRVKPSYHERKYYFDKGITVHKDWSNFAAFISHIGLKPTNKHSIDRYPDMNGNYEPGNVRWAEPIEQTRNRRNTKTLSYNGKTLPLAKWAEIYKLSYHALWGRINKGWSIEKALTTPQMKNKFG